MINQKNFFDEVDKIGIENLPDALRKSVLHIWDKTKGIDWDRYVEDKAFQQVVKLAFKKLEEYIRFLSKKGLSGTKKNTDASGYATIHKEVSFIHRFLKFHDQVVYKKSFELFIHELQNAIQNKEIRKTSPVAKDIMSIQNAVIDAYNTMKSTKHFVLEPATIKRFKGIIVRYENGLAETDGVIDEKKAKPVTLNGIEPSSNLMCSTDFAKMQFDTIGFTGKWLDLIGDPSRGFTTMVYGRPKFGKSYLCVDFAGYLARNHGKVLYAAKEEKLDATLQKKLNEKEVAHPSLYVSDHLPQDLSPYDYIFLDSVTKFGLTPKDIEKLRAANPGKSFIFIFQTTKGGNFRGENTYQHDVDVVIEVPERGKAIQFGRFNQGGEVNIFDQKEIQPEANSSEHLDGVKKKSSKKTPDWTEPEWLNAGDHWTLKQIKKHYEEGDLETAMQIASNGDTVIREAIPGDIWKKMGGKLTPTGEAKLKEKNLIQETLEKTTSLAKIIDKLSKAKRSDWETVGSLANLHQSIGKHLFEQYSRHEGYSSSVKEGIKRHADAIKLLLKKLPSRLKDMAEFDQTVELKQWNSLLQDWIESLQ